MRAELGARFTLFGVVKREGDWYIAYCPPLDLTTQGRTASEAKDNLVEASELFITSCLERQTLDQALKELGFVPMKHFQMPQHFQGSTPFKLSIPIPFGLEKQGKNLLSRA